MKWDNLKTLAKFSLLTPLLTACIATSELEKMAETQISVNEKAGIITRHLNERDEKLTAMVNEALSIHSQFTATKIESLYFQNIQKMERNYYETAAQIDKILAEHQQHCKNLINKSVSHFNNMTKEAEEVALTHHKESLAYPNDQKLALQAARAAADYFGRRLKTLEIKNNADSSCHSQLIESKNKTMSEIKLHFEAKKSNLKAQKESLILKATNLNATPISSASNYFKALEEIAEANTESAKLTIYYVKTNSLTHNESLVMQLFTGFKDGVIANAFSLNPDAPDIKSLQRDGKELVNDIMKQSQRELDAVPDAAMSIYEQAKSSFKARLTEKTNEILTTQASKISSI